METNYLDLARQWVKDTPEILAAWFDDREPPTVIHFTHTAAYHLHKTGMPIPLASLRLAPHPVDGRTKAAKKPTPLLDGLKQ